MMDDPGRPALPHGHLQRLGHQRCAQVRRHRPTHDTPAEYVENDGEVGEAGAGRHVGDVGEPQAIRRIGLEAVVDPIRRRSVNRIHYVTYGL